MADQMTPATSPWVLQAMAMNPRISAAQAGYGNTAAAVLGDKSALVQQPTQPPAPEEMAMMASRLQEMMQQHQLLNQLGINRLAETHENNTGNRDIKQQAVDVRGDLNATRQSFNDAIIGLRKQGNELAAQKLEQGLAEFNAKQIQSAAAANAKNKQQDRMNPVKSLLSETPEVSATTVPSSKGKAATVPSASTTPTVPPGGRIQNSLSTGMRRVVDADGNQVGDPF